jgi:murein DD-endopeptidase MepM/ murein hydrolase activator NlpD
MTSCLTSGTEPADSNIMGFGGSRSRLFAGVVTAAAVCTGVVCAPPAHATVASDQAQIFAIQRRIAAQGARVKSLVARENAAQAKIDALDRQIAADGKRVASDRRREAAAQVVLRRIAVSAYVTHAATTSALLDMFSGGDDITSVLAQVKYVGSVGDRLAAALAALRTARKILQQDVDDLSAAKDDATHALARASKEHRAVTTAIGAEQRTLESVRSDLRRQLIVDREVAQLATERALAKYPWSTKDGPLPPIPPPSPGFYANPLRAIRGLTPERIDMGVDYSGYGPIYAIGDGIVLTTTVPGWPGGTMIVYQLTDGPANGLVVYAAEDIAPTVHVGDTVTAGTVLGLVYVGPDGIETGWGDPAVIGNTLAGDTGQFDGANTTAFGANFSEFLHWLGAPAGIPQNDPPTGTLPRNWPRWDVPIPGA